MTIKEIRNMTGLSQAGFAEKYNIPVRSIANWEAPDDSKNHRDCPDYVIEMLAEKVRQDQGHHIVISIDLLMRYEKLSKGNIDYLIYLIKRHSKEAEKMTKEFEIEILMYDGHTKKEAERALEKGATVYEYEDFMIFAIDEIPFDDEEEKQTFIDDLEADKCGDYRNMIYKDRRYIIEYVN